MTNKLNDYEEHLIESGLDPDELGEPKEYVALEEAKYKSISIEELDRKIENEIKGFSALLGTLASTEDRKKSLWKQIYENSLMDRKNAFILFGDLYSKVAGNSSEHAIHGQVLAKYMERMSKANEQLIKLAELVSEAVDEQTEGEWDEDAMYDMLDKNGGADKASPKKSH